MNWPQYRTNLKLWARGWPWLWTREIVWDAEASKYRRRDGVNYRVTEIGKIPREEVMIYRPGWTPLRFTVPYATSYLLSTLLGYEIRPFSGVLHERRSRLCRFLNWLFRDPHHCLVAAQARVLWGSRRAR